MIMLRATDLNMMPFTNGPSTVLHSATNANVDTVIVDGRVLKFGGKILSVDVEAVRERVQQVFGTDGEPPSGHIPFTPEVKKSLELSLRESLELSHKYIGPVHLLLGVLQQGDNGGVRVLRDLQVDVEELARDVLGERLPADLLLARRACRG